MKVTFEPGDCFRGCTDGVEFFGIVLSHQLPDGKQASVLIFETKTTEEGNRAIFLPDTTQSSFNRKEHFFPARREDVPYDIAIQLDRCSSTWYHAQGNLDLLEASRDTTEET